MLLMQMIVPTRLQDEPEDISTWGDLGPSDAPQSLPEPDQECGTPAMDKHHALDTPSEVGG
jgi:hypothetical protein